MGMYIGVASAAAAAAKNTPADLVRDKVLAFTRQLEFPMHILTGHLPSRGLGLVLRRRRLWRPRRRRKTPRRIWYGI